MKLNFVTEQIEWVDRWTVGLISGIDESGWGLVDHLGTSINWITGHMVVSKYYHAIRSTLSDDSKIITELEGDIPLKEMIKYYNVGTDPRIEWKERPSKERLMTYLKEVDKATSLTLEGLAEQDLGMETENGNPVAKTKFDALTFSFKHQMWHCGQIAMIKRILSESS